MYISLIHSVDFNVYDVHMWYRILLSITWCDNMGVGEKQNWRIVIVIQMYEIICECNYIMFK